MALSIKHPEAERLARALAKRMGETMTQAVVVALRERLKREEGRRRAPNVRDELLAISRRCAALPDRDKRRADQILGYDKHGVWR